MTHNTQEITGYHSGDTLRLNVSVEDPNGNAVDIRDTALTYAIFPDQQSAGSPEVEKTVDGGGITITDGVNGEFRVDIEPADTESLSGEHPHECQLVDTDGDVSTLFTGTVTIEQDLITSATQP